MTDKNLLAVVEELDAAFNKKDIDAVLKFYEDDATMVVYPGKLAFGKAELRKAFETILNFEGVAKQEKTKVIEAGDIALFISKWSLTYKATDGNMLSKVSYATCVFRKNQEGKWRLVIDNSFGPAILGE